MTALPYPGPLESRLRPADCCAAADRISFAIAQLEAANVRVPDLGRLRTEVEALRDVADRGAFPETPAGQRIVGNAILDSIEVADIAQFLPPARSVEMASQLQAAQKGHRSDSRRGQPAYRFQTQFWLGAILTQGGLSPRVPDASQSKSPDFIVEQGVSLYGVEVKRPQGYAGLTAAVDDAAHQLREFGIAGAVVVDVTEAITALNLGWVSEDDAARQRDEYIAEAQRHLELIKGQVYDPGTHSMARGYERLNGIMILARGWSWINADSTSLVVYALGAATAFAPGKAKTRAFWHAKGLLNGSLRGFVQPRSNSMNYESVTSHFRSRPAPCARPVTNLALCV